MGQALLSGFNASDFEQKALALSVYQYHHNPLYKSFSDLTGQSPLTAKEIPEIPFLPISFFKTNRIKTGEWKEEVVFESSGTTGETPSRHYVRSLDDYDRTALHIFESFFDSVNGKAILALLPSYLERGNSSLVHMATMLMKQSGHPANGFYLNNFAELAAKILHLESQAKPYVLLGVSFALLDFAEAFPMQLRFAQIMETGGMKGRKKESTRAEVHEVLKLAFNQEEILSEYGMTELLSQAYAPKHGLFFPGSTMRVLVRELNDPLTIHTVGQGALNIIDLANKDTCAFIASEDIGTVHDDGSFIVSGRMDYSALRGCSLMAGQKIF